MNSERGGAEDIFQREKGGIFPMCIKIDTEHC